MGAWLRKSVTKLVRFGYRLDEIGDMTLSQFMMHLKSAEQIRAHERSLFVADIATVASGLYAKKGSNPIKDHLDSLGAIIDGVEGHGDSS